MPERRRRFSPQFKAEAVQMVLETGRSIAEVARDLEIHAGWRYTAFTIDTAHFRSRTRRDQHRLPQPVRLVVDLIA